MGLTTGDFPPVDPATFRQTPYADGDGGKLAGASLLAAALTTVTQPVWVLDRDGLIRVANPAAAATLGYPDAGELLGRSGHDMVHVDRLDAEPHPSSECPLLRPCTTGETVTSELDRFVRRDGSTLPVSYVSAPLELPDGRGAVLAFTDIEARRDAEQALTERETRLTEQEDALRRVATLVARETAPDPVFHAVADEAAALLRCDIAAVIRFEKDAMVTVMGAHHTRRPPRKRLELDPDFVVAAVRRTGRAARFDTDDPAAPDMPEPVRAEGVRSAVASPIVVGGELWGVMVVGSLDRALPSGTERLLADFTDLLATAVSNAQAREDLQRLAGEQAALRRVATLVAREAPQADVFAAIAREIRRLLSTEQIRMVRYEDEFAVVVGSSVVHEDRLPVGSRHQLDGDNATSQVFRTGRPARIDDYTRATGEISGTVRPTGVRAAVATPIAVEGRLWGAIIAATSRDEPLPQETEMRLGQFTELMATAIANTEAKGEVERLADEQAALRRVATLVAAGVQPADLFSAVSREVAQLFGTDLAAVGRFDPDGANVIVGLASDSEEVAIGTRFELDDALAVTAVYRTGRAARIDRTDWSGVTAPVGAIARRLGAVSTVSSPIVVEGHRWGSVTVTGRAALPLDTEDRLANFTELVGTAIANAESRARVRRLADEQAALRRVATLVAEAAPPSAVFGAVASEAGALFGADFSGMLRYEDAKTVTTVATWAATGDHPEVAERWTIEAGDPMTLLADSGAPTRVEDWGSIPGEVARVLREELGVSSSVGCPIMVDGRAWGGIAVHWKEQAAPAADNEARLGQFADLVATAIANAEARDQLAASRARLLTAADDARRRVVRDLHDGAQQRLVHTIINLKIAAEALQASDDEAARLVGDALTHAELGNEELRELAHGILPTSLTNGGLRAGLDAVVARLEVPVRLDVPPERFAAEIEASAYFVVAEALTNVVKHAHAKHAEVRAFVEDGMLHVHVRDDGTGGADPGGHGLVGIADRVTALDGRLAVRDAAGGGTLIAASLPLPEA